jgi:hypothetical protein
VDAAASDRESAAAFCYGASANRLKRNSLTLSMRFFVGTVVPDSYRYQPKYRIIGVFLPRAVYLGKLPANG